MKTRDRLVLAVVGVVAIAGAFWLLALSPKREQASQLDVEVTRAEKRRDAATTKAAGAERAKAQYASDYATLARLGKAVPPKADLPALVFQLETAARAAKVDFRKVMIDDPPAAPEAPADAASSSTSPASSGISPAPFNFTFEGSFTGLQRLLAEIGRFSSVKGSKISISGRLLTLDQVKLSAGRSGLPSVKAEITATAYLAPITTALAGQPATTTSTTAPAAQVTP